MPEAIAEEDIRPAALFDEYLRLAALDVSSYFADGPREAMACPACGHAGNPTFTKNDFDFRECPSCSSLWASPRPVLSQFKSFYAQSESSRYWSETFYPAVAQSRRAVLWKPKVKRVLTLMERFSEVGKPRSTIVDLGGGNGDFAEEVRDASDISVTVVEPNPHSVRICRDKGLTVIESFVEDLDRAALPPEPLTLTCFELFEHVHDPVGWLRCIAELMTPDDLLILSTLSGTGLDIRVLWEKSRSVTPPHHINFLNPGAFPLLAERCDLVCEEITTPGVLDLDILANSRADIADRFWLHVLDLPEEKRSQWQRFVSESGSSSHMWVVLRRK